MSSEAPSRVASNTNIASLNAHENDADSDDVTTEALIAQKELERKKEAGRLIQEEEKAVGFS